MISFWLAIGGTFAFVLATAVLAKSNTLTENAQVLSRNNEILTGLFLLSIASFIGSPHGPTAQIQSAQTALSPIQEAIWVAGLAGLLFIVIVKILGAYSDYKRYPETPTSTVWRSGWVKYKQWSYLMRTNYRVTIMVAGCALAAVIQGFTVQIAPVEVLGAFAGYFGLVVLVSGHGSRYIDYGEVRDELKYVGEPSATVKTAQGD